jgi:hypothetical protein
MLTLRGDVGGYVLTPGGGLRLARQINGRFLQTLLTAGAMDTTASRRQT